MDHVGQDSAAVSAVRGGDVERYRELVERHERRVFAVAWIGSVVFYKVMRYDELDVKLGAR